MAPAPLMKSPRARRPAASPDASAMYTCLLDLRDRAERDIRPDEVRLIDSAIGGSLRAQLMARLGSPTLTPKMWELLELLERARLANGVSPTLQEMADKLGCSKVTVHERVETLVSRGLVVRDPHKARSLRLADDAPPAEAPGKQDLLRRRALLNSRLQVENARRRNPRPDVIWEIRKEIESIDLELLGCWPS